ncbi:MAG: HD domain-containing protein [Candidatus Omnitrophota bacterium]
MYLRKSYLKRIPYLAKISLLARKKRVGVWLVGGFLRDALLGEARNFFDFDFSVEKETFKFVNSFRRMTASRLITLDAGHNSYRIIVKKGGKSYTYDFTQLRGKSLKDDLRARDFTVNSLALDLAALKKGQILDLAGGRADLKRKCIRAHSEEVLKQDPLRILRAFSLSAKYGFIIEKRTLRFLCKHKVLLKSISGERINEELFKIIDSPSSFKTIKKLSDLGIIDVFIPHISCQRGVSQGDYHHLDVWNHALETLFRFESLLKRKLSKDKEILDYLNRPLADNHRLIHIIKLACILHDMGKPFAKKRRKKRTIFHKHEKIGASLSEDVFRELRLSLKERDVLKRLIFWHLRPGYLADQEYPSRRAVYRFFRDTGEEGAAVIILSLADWRATRGPLVDNKKRAKHERVMFGLLKYYFNSKQVKAPPKLVDGFDIMAKFKLSPSPLIGKVLAKINEEQALGRVSTKKEAYMVARKVINNNKPKAPS